MSSSDRITPNRPIPASNNQERIKKTEAPEQDPAKAAYFKRLMRQNVSDPKENEEEEFANATDKEDQPFSLFDLSKQKSKLKAKGNLVVKSFVSDSNQEEMPTDALTKNKSTSSNETLFSDLDEDATFSKEDQFYLKTTKENFNPSKVLPSENETEVSVPDFKTQTDVNQTIIAQIQPQQSVSISSSKNLSTDSPLPSSSTKKFGKGKTEEKEEKMGTLSRAEIENTNPRMQVTNFSSENAFVSDQEVSRSTTLKDIANQIIERIQILRQGGETNTTVTLKNPPLLQGAELTISATDHAQKEFNLAFSSLSPEAKLFLDRKLNEDSLSQTLERKGIIIHMLITTTAIENPLIVDKNEFFGRDQQRESKEEKRRQDSSKEEN